MILLRMRRNSRWQTQPSDIRCAAGGPAYRGILPLYPRRLRWELSDGSCRTAGRGAIRGSDGTATATTSVEPDVAPLDTADIRAAMERLATSGRPNASRHRIVDRAHRSRHVVIVGDRVTSAEGDVTGVTGYVVDVTAVFDEALRHSTPRSATSSRTGPSSNRPRG